jgi:hypothetical protein
MYLFVACTIVQRSLVPYVGHYLMFLLVVSFTNLADDNASVFKALPVFAIMAAWTIFLFLPQVRYHRYKMR